MAVSSPPLPYVFATKNAASGANSYQATVTVSTAVGDTLIVAATGSASGSYPSGCTDSQGNSYSLTEFEVEVAELSVYTCPNATHALTTGASDYVKVTYGGTGSGININCADIPAGGGTLDVSVMNDGTTGMTQSVATGSLAHPAELIIGAAYVSTYSPAWQSPMTLLGSILSGNGAGFCTLAYGYTTSTSTVTVETTTSTNPPAWIVLALTYPVTNGAALAPLAISGTGAETFAATASPALAPLAMSVTAAETIPSAGSVALAPLVLTAAGAEIFAATSSAAMAAMAVAASASSLLANGSVVQPGQVPGEFAYSLPGIAGEIT